MSHGRDRDGSGLIGQHLVKRFGGLTAVSDVSFALAPAGRLGVIGPNGAGKTTLFNLLAGSFAPDAGSITLEGAAITNEPPERRIARGLARTFQIPKPFAAMTVLENVLVAGQRQSGERVLASLLRPRLIASEERALSEKAHDLLDFLSLDHLADEPASVLSGGQRKLLELARVLMA
ncbi:MAG: ATP-binding cassette domain-containing protein, partial [Pseudomonadota bacterium]